MTTEVKNAEIGELSEQERQVILALREGDGQRVAAHVDHAMRPPYEHDIAFYIVGALVLAGAIEPYNFNFDRANRTGLPYCVQIASDALLKGLRAYGWLGSVREIINAADMGTPAGWKSADIPVASDRLKDAERLCVLKALTDDQLAGLIALIETLEADAAHE